MELLLWAPVLGPPLHPFPQLNDELPTAGVGVLVLLSRLPLILQELSMCLRNDLTSESTLGWHNA